MTNNAKLISYIEVFYSEIIEEYKEITLGIRSDATPMSIFKKKNYQQHIDRLRACKKDVLKINPKDIEIQQEDKLGQELKTSFENALLLFVDLCDLQIQVQVALQNTANKKGTKFSECKDATNRLNAHNKDAQRAFHQLDVLYADYLD